LDAELKTGLRGKEKVKGEWALLCLTHNILQLHAAMQY
jgi:hypothetical protein